jgi:hypothetical protein
MFGAYAVTYDENYLDDFRELFTDSPELVVQHEDRSLSQDVRPTPPRVKLFLFHRPKRH